MESSIVKCQLQNTCTEAEWKIISMPSDSAYSLCMLNYSYPCHYLPTIFISTSTDFFYYNLSFHF